MACQLLLLFVFFNFYYVHNVMAESISLTSRAYSYSSVRAVKLEDYIEMSLMLQYNHR